MSLVIAFAWTAGVLECLLGSQLANYASQFVGLNVLHWSVEKLALALVLASVYRHLLLVNVWLIGLAALV